jgi:hypothetical protein
LWNVRLARKDIVMDGVDIREEERERVIIIIHAFIYFNAFLPLPFYTATGILKTTRETLMFNDSFHFQ